MGEINSGDTAFVLMSAALVALMTPGLAFFYGGLVRRKNFLAIMMQSFISMGIVTFIWVAVGYSMAFSGNLLGGFIGNLDWAFLNGVGETPGPWAPTIPAVAHFTYQEMFAIITPALITGAFADRVNFKSYLKFLVLWSLFVYVPFAHWLWGGGFLAEWGALDFAGGMVVHVSAGMAALASVWVVGPRKFGPGERSIPHNIAFVALGHRPALVRLVRLQRRLGAGRQRRRRAGVRQHRHRRLDRDVHLAVHHLVEGRQAEPHRRFHRRRRRTRLRHAVRRVHPDLVGVRHRPARRLRVLRRGQVQGAHEVGRRARRLGRARRRRHHGLDPARRVRRARRSTRPEPTACSRATPSSSASRSRRSRSSGRTPSS